MISSTWLRIYSVQSDPKTIRKALIKRANNYGKQMEPPLFGTFDLQSETMSIFAKILLTKYAEKPLLVSTEEMYFAPWNLRNSSWAGGVSALSGTICLLTCLSSTRIRRGLWRLCIIVSEWQISKIPFLIISLICSWTSPRNRNGIVRLFHDLRNPPCISNRY